MSNYFDNDYSEADWRADSDAFERADNAREARDMADWCSASDSPAVTAFLNETTPDAPGGAHESVIDTATRRAPIAEPISFGMELSTTELLARMRRPIRATKRVRKVA